MISLMPYLISTEVTCYYSVVLTTGLKIKCFTYSFVCYSYFNYIVPKLLSYILYDNAFHDTKLDLKISESFTGHDQRPYLHYNTLTY